MIIRIETERLIITEFTMDMAEAVHLNSLDEDNRRFVPDEVIMPKLGLKRIAGICLADNKGSVKVMERCGFVKEFEGLGPYQGEEREICKFTYTI